jgi:MFS family permease
MKYKVFYGWYIVGASCLILLYTSGTVYLGFTAAFQPIVKEFGWSYAEMSLAASLRGLEVGLLVPLAGMLMDRWGQRRLVIIGTLMGCLGLILLSQIHSLAMFYACFILVAAGLSTATSTLLMTAVSHWFRKKAGLAMGITASGVSLGGLLVPLITGLIDSIGWRQAMIFMGLGMLVIPLPLSFVLKHKPEQHGFLPDGEICQPALIYKNSGTETKKVNFSVKEALRSPIFWIIAFGFFCQVLPVSAVMTHIMPYLSSIGIERSNASYVAGIVSITTIIGRIGFGWIGDHIDKRKVASIAFALTSLGALILGCTFAGQIWMIVIFILFFSIGWGGAVPMLSGLLKEYYGGERLGTIAGCVGTVMMLGQISGPFIAGWVFDKWGNYQFAWFFLSGIVGISTIIFFVGLMKATKRNGTVN